MNIRCMISTNAPITPQNYYFFCIHANNFVPLSHKTKFVIPEPIMTNKEQYSVWASSQPQLPLFMQPWWMDAVSAGKEWNVILVRNSDIFPPADAEQTSQEESPIVAAMPYLYRKKWFMTYIVMPQQTQIGGIYCPAPAEGEPTDMVQLRQQRIATFIAQKLADMKLWYYYQQYPIDSPFPALFKQQDFHVTDRVTYRINDLSNLDKVIDSFSKNKKRQLQKALSLHADTSLTPEQFYQFHTQCILKRKHKLSYSREFFLVMERKTSRLAQSQIIAIRDADNQLCAAAYVAWDQNSMYYLIPCYNPDFKDSGASSLLVLEAIKLAREKGVAFDFEGSNDRGIANHYRQFGSTPTTYYSVRLYYKKFFWFANAFNWLRNRKYGM